MSARGAFADRILLATGLMLVELLVAGAVQAAPMFMGLGDLPGGDFESTAFAVSADGTTVVGRAEIPLTEDHGQGAPFRWTQATGMVSVYEQPGDFAPRGTGYGVSGDGSVVVGQSNDADPIHTIQPFFTIDGEMRHAIAPTLHGQTGSARGVADDGSAIVGGYGDSVSGRGRAFISNHDGSSTSFLGTIDDYHLDSVANAVNAAGTHVVGWSHSEPGPQAFLWTQADGMVGLGDLAGGDFLSEALDISDDGSIIVGSAATDLGREAFRWMSATGMVSLNTVPSDVMAGHAYAVSGDGSVIVGYGRDETDSTTAFIWDEENGVRSLTELLIGLDLDLEGWTLRGATGISADGLTIVGDGINPDGNKEAWIATIPEPGTGTLVALGLVGLARRQSSSI